MRSVPGAGLWRALKGFLYPPVCLVCRRADPDGPGMVCRECWAALQPVADPACPRCGAPVSAGAACRYCAGRSFAFSSARVLTVFDDTVQSLVHQIKYRHKAGTARELGRRLGRTAAAGLRENGADALIPVPLHPSRKRWRGFNQSEELAKGVSEVTGLPVMPRLLKRVRKTVTQTGLDADRRQENVAGAFRRGRTAWPSSVRNPVLVDDVLTTGATLNACARVCLREGAAGVTVLAAARA